MCGNNRPQFLELALPAVRKITIKNRNEIANVTNGDIEHELRLHNRA